MNNTYTLTLLRWGDIDLDAGRVRIERAVVATKRAGIVVKDTKTEAKGRRTVAIDVDTTDKKAATEIYKLAQKHLGKASVDLDLLLGHV
mgnify:CR=1 FL=1